MSEPLRRWILFGLCSMAVLFSLIIFVLLTGPNSTSVREQKRVSRMVIEKAAVQSSPFDYIPLNTDMLLVWRDLSQPFKRLGVIDENWRLTQSFRSKYGHALSILHPQNDGRLENGLTWLERQALPKGPIYASINDVGTVSWVLICFKHATPNALRSMIAKSARDSGYGVRQSTSSSGITLSIIDDRLVFAGAHGNAFLVYAHEIGVAEKQFWPLLNQKEQSFSALHNDALLEPLFKADTDVMAYVPPTSAFRNWFSVPFDSEGALNAAISFRNDNFDVNTFLPMASVTVPMNFDSVAPIILNPLPEGVAPLQTSSDEIVSDLNSHLSGWKVFMNPKERSSLAYSVSFQNLKPRQLNWIDAIANHAGYPNQIASPSNTGGLLSLFGSDRPMGVYAAEQGVTLARGQQAIDFMTTDPLALPSPQNTAAILNPIRIMNWVVAGLNRPERSKPSPDSLQRIESFLSHLPPPESLMAADIFWSMSKH